MAFDIDEAAITAGAVLYTIRISAIEVWSDLTTAVTAGGRVRVPHF